MSFLEVCNVDVVILDTLRQNQLETVHILEAILGILTIVAVQGLIIMISLWWKKK
jgi:hypothetical protein